jgi:hypothetical protein
VAGALAKADWALSVVGDYAQVAEFGGPKRIWKANKMR